MLPPTPMKLSDVQHYVKEKYGLEVTRQTVYNWTKRGKKGHILRTTQKAGVLLTTKPWVQEFVDQVPGRTPKG